eukprot:1255350-Prymnesium_polylepis.1
MAERARRVGMSLKQETEGVAWQIEHGSPRAKLSGKIVRKRLQIANHQMVARAEQQATRRRLNM